MSELILLNLLMALQLLAMCVAYALISLYDRLTLTCRLYFDRGLSYTWSRAWRKAGIHLQH